MPTEYFEARERALLGRAVRDALRRPAGDSAARGVTVSALRTTPEDVCGQGGLPALEPSPFCKAAFVVREETLQARDGTPTTMRACFTRRSPRRRRRPRCWA